ncbi:MAG: ABC transporter substrate-binding protein [Bacteroidales bacterium]|nr:ABC transporter substrate-binding protein [Bacteroidales bacterium]
MYRKANRQIPALLLLLLVFVSTACNSRQREGGTSMLGDFISSEPIRYAEGFTIDHAEDYTRVTILNPWSNASDPYETYFLYRNDSILPLLPSEGVKLKTPLTSLAVNTFSYFSFLELLGEMDVISGVTDGFRIYHPGILEKIERGDIVDLGDPFQPDIERTMALKPQAVINSAYAQLDRYSERLLQAGFPVIYSLEWMETSPLARAEWIKLMAAFFDKREAGDSLFNAIEQEYLQLRDKVEAVDKKSVLAGDIFQDTWYVPGGNSFNATLFRDAGLDYRYQDNNESGSIGLDIESVLTQFGKSDIWFGCEAGTYAELVNKDAKYLLLQPVKNRKVYNNHNRTTPSGGNDYFESAIANPHFVLADLVKAAYPHLLPDYSFTYIKPLEELGAREKK